MRRNAARLLLIRKKSKHSAKSCSRRTKKIDMAKDRILREANEQAREILQDAKETADETIRIFPESRSQCFSENAGKGA